MTNRLFPSLIHLQFQQNWRKGRSGIRATASYEIKWLASFPPKRRRRRNFFLLLFGPGNKARISGIQLAHTCPHNALS